MIQHAPSQHVKPLLCLSEGDCNASLCMEGWSYDPKTNTCFINVPIVSGPDDRITSCKVARTKEGYVLHCTMPKKEEK